MRSPDKNALLKKKYTRTNHLPFMNKELSKTTMHGSKLPNSFLRNRSNGNEKMFSKQRNYYVSLLRRVKLNYYNNVNEKKKKIIDDKKFWKTSISISSSFFPFFNVLSTERVTLIENDKLIDNDSETANIMNTFFLQHTY